MLDAGTLAVIPFPYSDLSATKRRPVLLLTAPDAYGDFIGMAVTSQPGHTDNMAILQAMMESGALPKASFIRTDKVVSLNQSLIVKEVGKVTESLRLQAVRRLCSRLTGVSPG